jgi:hypothetical protein
MIRIANSFAYVGVVMAACLTAAAAQAAAGRTFVSSAGSGTACTRVAPCADFQTAHDATTSGGSVYCLDPGDYGGIFGLTITKSITIDCTGTQAGLTTSFNPVPITVNAPRIVVILRGLSLLGKGTGHVGINLIDAAVLHVDQCRISGFRGGLGHGIRLGSADGVIPHLYVTDSVVTNNGLPASGGGIVIEPGGSVRVTIERSRVEQNTYGVFANGMDSSGPIVVQIHDSLVAGNAFNGISAFTAAPPKATTSITVDRTSSILNGQAGILAQGVRGVVLLGNSTVMSNGIGLSTADSGTIFSYQNNQLSGNASDGASPSVLAVK